MQKSNLNQGILYKRAEQLRDKAIAAANAEYEATVATIDRLMGTPRLEYNSGEPEQLINVNGSWPGMKQAIAEFAKDSTDSFTTGEVIRYLEAKYHDQKINPASVSTSLWTMAKDNEIECVYRGRGRDPSKYQKLTQGKE